MKTKEIVRRYHSEHNCKRYMLCNNANFRIPVYADSDAVTVRVHDLPPSMSLVTITDHMMKYGEIISIRNEKWKHFFPGISNGVRVLRMYLAQQIPSFITIGNEQAMVTYTDQPKTCQRCDKPSHRGNKCQDCYTPSNGIQPTATTSKSPFSQDDFPPIAPKDQQNTTASVVSLEHAEGKQDNRKQLATEKQQNDNDDDGYTDDDISNTSTEHSETTNKRRRSRRGNKDGITKKACSGQCFPSTDHKGIILSSDEKN